MQTPYAKMVLKDISLYQEIVKHRGKFYHVDYVDYEKKLPTNIQILPNKEQISAFETDCNEMKKSFVYGESLDLSIIGFYKYYYAIF